jgi:hypothetical protein
MFVPVNDRDRWGRSIARYILCLLRLVLLLSVVRLAENLRRMQVQMPARNGLFPDHSARGGLQGLRS